MLNQRPFPRLPNDAGAVLGDFVSPRWWLMVGLLGTLLAQAARAEPNQVRGDPQVRRILSDKCFSCHGPDAQQRQGGLRLDLRSAHWFAGPHGAPIVPGDPAASLVMQRITSLDPDQRMPPPESGKSISASEAKLLQTWIEQGAPTETHWSFLPLASAQPPPLPDGAPWQSWARNGIDHFIAQKLHEQGLRPSPPAEPATLLRRLYLDLLGLLPEPDAVAEFCRDDRPDAWDHWVTQLLESPHYGERWGRHWLDQARYADSNGYTIDGDRTIWPYRDWVIRALNQDLPFDQFTIEQLAGDLLPHPTRAQRVATGFHRNTLMNQEGGTDPEQFRMEAVMDRVATTGAVWLGLTVGCAQCHSHKFDPISQREYYALLSFFNQCADVNDVGPTLDVHEGELWVGPERQHELAALHQALNHMDQLTKERSQRQQQWEAEQVEAAGRRVQPQQLPWEMLHVTRAQGQQARLEILEDGSLLATPGVPREIYTVETLPLPAGTQLGSLQLRVIPHPSLPKTGPGLAANGNFVLSAIELFVGEERLPLTSACSTHSQPGHPAAALVDDMPGTAWAIHVPPGSNRPMNAEHIAWVSLANPIVLDGRPLKVVLKHELNNDYNLGRFALAWTSSLVDATSDDSFQQALATSPDQRTPEQSQALASAFASRDVVMQAAQADATRYRQVLQLGPAVKTLVMGDVTDRRITYLLTRGDFLRPDHAEGQIAPDVFQFLPPLPASTAPTQRSRWDLAQWLVHPDNPLTPRVTVNRMWMRYFGRGIVETENDFGAQGTPPTHPELLDWLARQFIDSGWSQKAMHRLIVSSATYRQASVHRPDIASRDPLNLWLARQNRLRLDAEIVRDTALTVSGKLSRRVGGPSVQPPQPEGVYAFTQNHKSWQTAEGDARYRRGLYTTFYRSAPYPTLTTFDSPDFQSVCTRRVRSNTPLQALTMANDQAMVELARAFAARLQEMAAGEGRRDMDGIRYAFELAYARAPEPAEMAASQAFWEAQRQQASESVPPDAAATSARTAEQVAWLALARALMNTDEFITRE